MSRAAIRYAKAILDIASTNNNALAVKSDMITIIEACNESNELKLFLENPVIKGNAKFNALSEIFNTAQAETKGLFQLLLANKRFGILPVIADQYSKLFDAKSGIEVAVVTTAVALSSELEAKVLTKIKEITSKQVEVQNVIDPSILGGFVLRIGDKQYNASVANKLQQLKREFS